MEFTYKSSIDSQIFQDYAPCVRELWRDTEIRQAYSRRTEFQLVSFFFKFYTVKKINA